MQNIFILKKRDYDPLLPYGYKEIGIHEIDQIFLTPFKEKEWRIELVDGLRRLLNTLIKAKIEQEVWIDGSFATKKPDPDDVDLLLLAKQSDLEKMPQAYKTLWETVVFNTSYTRLRFNCDISFRLIDIPSERQQIAKFKREFTHGHYGIHNKKGIFKLVLNRGHVKL